MNQHDTTGGESHFTFINERFEIIDRLGKGGMGTVYRVNDKILQRDVAVKLLGRDHIQSPLQVQRMQREAKTLARLNHPNILKVMDFGYSEKSGPYIIIELIEGQSVEEMIQSYGRLELVDALEIAIRICDGISHAHKHKILHRDLKPSNVLVADGDDEMLVKVIDLGLATFSSGDQSLTKTGVVIGSPPYMSPEQIHDRPLDECTDIYSFGCLLYAMLTGAPPFCGETMDIYNQHVSVPAPSLSENSSEQFSDKLEAIVQKCLKKLPSDRFQKIEDVRDELLDVSAELTEKFRSETPVSERDVTAHSVASLESLIQQRKSARLGNSLVTLLLGLVLLMVLVGTALLYTNSQQQELTERTEDDDTGIFTNGSTGNVPLFKMDGGPDGKTATPHLPASDEDLKYLANNKSVIALTLSGGSLTGRGLRYVENLPIRTIYLNDTKFDDEGARYLAKMRMLGMVDVTECAFLTNAGLKTIATLPELRMLCIGPKVDRESFRIVAANKSMVRLRYYGNGRRIPDGFATELRTSKIIHFDFDSRAAVFPEDIGSLIEIPALTTLSIEYDQVTKKMCAAMAALSLGQVQFQGCSFEPGALRELKNSSIAELHVQFGNVPLDDLRFLHARKKSLHMIISDIDHKEIDLRTAKQSNIPQGNFVKDQHEMVGPNNPPDYDKLPQLKIDF